MDYRRFFYFNWQLIPVLGLLEVNGIFDKVC